MPMLSPPLLLLALCAGHALADYPLQGAFLADGKNRHTALGAQLWPHLLTAHALIHAGFVGLLTGSIWLAAAEFACHWLTDLAKCENRLSFHQDQAIHYTCKLLWWAIAVTLL